MWRSAITLMQPPHKSTTDTDLECFNLIPKDYDDDDDDSKATEAVAPASSKRGILLIG